MEIAFAREHVPERSLRRVWNERQGSRGWPLLLIAPSDDSGVFVVGPVLNEPQVVDPLPLAKAIEQACELAPTRRRETSNVRSRTWPLRMSLALRFAGC